MAEVAAGAVVAEQVVSTTIEGGAIAGYAISKETMPLKATFQQIGRTDAKFLNDSTLALARSHHTLNIVDGKAYIFGGEVARGKLCSNDMHVITLPTGKEEDETVYSCIPAISQAGGEERPSPRTKHAICAQGHELALFGGSNEDKHPVDQDSPVWIFSTTSKGWRKISTASHSSSSAGTPPPRYNHKLFAYGGHLILHGGQLSSSTEQGALLNDTWFLDITRNIWTKLPDCPVHSDNAVLVDGVLYAFAQLNTESFVKVYRLEIGAKVPTTEPEKVLGDLQWEGVNGASPDLPPRSRIGGGLIPITTGYGRQYLSYFFGFTSSGPDVPRECADFHEPTYYADFWTYQLPSQAVRPSAWTDFKPAAIKDSIRNALGQSSGEQEWAEVEVQATEQMGHEGKVHPGPRAWFAADGAGDGKSVVLWGGINAKGEREGDGWLVRLE